MKLALAVSYFQSIHELDRLLEPIHKHVDLIIGIDGRYPKFKYNTNYSIDGSTELLKEKYGAITYTFSKPVEQIRKRNKYLEIAAKEKMDYVLVMDTDDYVHPDYQNWQLFKENIMEIPEHFYLGNVSFWISPLWKKNWNVVNDNTWHPYTRIIKPDKVMYDTVHWCFVKRDDTNCFVTADNKVMEGVRFTSDSTLRTKDYIDRGYDWAKEQMEEENTRMRRAARKRFNYWLKQVEKAMAVPNTKILGKDGRWRVVDDKK